MSKLLSPFFNKIFQNYIKNIKVDALETSCFPHTFSSNGKFCIQIVSTPILAGRSDDDNSSSSMMFLFQATDGEKRFYMAVKKEWLLNQASYTSFQDFRYRFFVVRGLKLWFVPNLLINTVPTKITLDPLKISDIRPSPYTIILQPQIFCIKTKLMVFCTPPKVELTLIDESYTRLILKKYSKPKKLKSKDILNIIKKRKSLTVEHQSHHLHQFPNVKLSHIPVAKTVPCRLHSSMSKLPRNTLKSKKKPVVLPVYSLQSIDTVNSLKPSSIKEVKTFAHHMTHDIEDMKEYTPKLKEWKVMYPINIKFTPIPIKPSPKTS